MNEYDSISQVSWLKKRENTSQDNNNLEWI